MEPVLILGEHSGSVGGGGGGSGMSTPQERPSRKSSWSSHSEPLLDLPPPVLDRDAQAEYERKRAQMSAPGNRGGMLQWFFRASLECVAATVQRVAAATAFARISFPTVWSSAAAGQNDAIGGSSHHLLLDPMGGDDVDGSSPADVGDAAGERGLLLDDVEGGVGGDGASSQSPYELMVDIEPESNSVLRSAPRILSPTMLEQLTKRGLPASVGMKRWTRLYSVIRDGDSFGTFLHKVRNHKHTVIVVKTMDHEVFGGFADTEWERHSGIEMAQFYGTGQSFLFSFVSSYSGGENASIYKWTGANTYNQLCDVENATVAMGGGGIGANFGLCIQDYFRKGSTGPCDTYGNAPLATKEFFDILAFEVYGFVNAW